MNIQQIKWIFSAEIYEARLWIFSRKYIAKRLRSKSVAPNEFRKS